MEQVKVIQSLFLNYFIKQEVKKQLFPCTIPCLISNKKRFKVDSFNLPTGRQKIRDRNKDKKDEELSKI